MTRTNEALAPLEPELPPVGATFCASRNFRIESTLTRVACGIGTLIAHALATTGAVNGTMPAN